MGRIEGLDHVQFSSHHDSRGTLVRVFDHAVIEASRIEFEPNYALASVNPVAGTLRGMHYQRGSAGEAKLISCVTGAIHNVTIDLRASSETFRVVEINVLQGGEGKALLVPPGCANGWMTLESNTILSYQISGGYRPEATAGIRFDDPAFSIQWPLIPVVISDGDRNWPFFDLSDAGAFEP